MFESKCDSKDVHLWRINELFLPPTPQITFNVEGNIEIVLFIEYPLKTYNITGFIILTSILCICFWTFRFVIASIIYVIAGRYKLFPITFRRWAHHNHGVSDSFPFKGLLYITESVFDSQTNSLINEVNK